MSAERPLRVLAAPPDDRRGRPGRFGPDDCYPAAVWLPVLGPATFVAWHHLAHLARHAGGATTTRAALAADLGLGSPDGSQSALARTLRRLERFGIARAVGDDCLVVRVRLPFVSPAQLARLAPAVQARHHLLHQRSAPRAC